MSPESSPAVPSAQPLPEACEASETPPAAEAVDTADPAFIHWCARMRIPATVQALQVWRAVTLSPTPRQYGKIEL